MSNSFVTWIFYPMVLFLVKTYKKVQLAVVKVFNKKAVSEVKSLLIKSGIIINGPNAWDVKINNPEMYARFVSDATLGAGEGYVDGWWDCDELEELSYRIFTHGLYNGIHYIQRVNRFLNYVLFHVFNLQTKSRAFEVGVKHYDQSNDLFEAFLDPTMNYSCGYWKNADNLEQAQLDKMELVAQKLKLSPGMRVLDIGCGWGSLSKYLAEKYKVSVVGITISVEGAKTSQERCAGLPVDIRLMDYRDLTGKFDRIVSVAMFEHVGEPNYRSFFEVAHKCLEKGGILLLHTIGVNHKDIPLVEPWFATYIIHNMSFPYYKSILSSIEDLFIIEDWHNFGNDYSRTFMAWYENFVNNWPSLKYKGERFFRIWKYFFLTSAGAFRSRRYQLWQIVLSKDGLKGGYQAHR